MEVKPILEEVKEYFNNAKEIECLSDGCIYKFNKSKKIKDLVFSIYLRKSKSDSCCIWHIDKGYAKIISYKEETYQITKEQILKIYKNAVDNNLQLTTFDLQELYPLVFKEDKKELVVSKQTGWFKSIGYGNEKWLGYFIDDVFHYGLGADGKWFENKNLIHNFKISKNEIEAIPQEIQQALENEARKRGYLGNHIKCIEGYLGSSSIKLIGDYKFEYNKNRLIVDLRGCVYTVFKDGVWAEIIPTITIKEAEKKLKCKII